MSKERSTLTRVFHGRLVHSLSCTELEIAENAVVGVDSAGTIQFVEKGVTNDLALKNLLEKHGCRELDEDKITRLTERQFLLPGFVDTHTHAPQYPNAGIGMDVELLDWLNKYTFPLEQSFASLDFAKAVYPRVVRGLLRNGTTTAVYYATIHLESTKYLAKLLQESGQRAFVGKVNMDRHSPDTYCETATDSVRNTEEFITYVLALNDKETNTNEIAQPSRLVTPMITPRFAITCTNELLNALGELAKKYDVPIQSHLSENVDEVAFVNKLFPQCKNYTDVYDKCGLLNHKTVMAHGIYLSSEERRILCERKTGISHCPSSNFAIRSGVCNVRQLLLDGVKVGLGTDISGGPSKSILDAMRSASVASRVVAMPAHNEGIACHGHLALAELLYLATMGGAELLNLERTIGNFVVGKEFDALVIDPEAEGSPMEVFDGIDDAERVFEKFVFLGDDRNIRDVYVRGRRVAGTHQQAKDV